MKKQHVVNNTAQYKVRIGKATKLTLGSHGGTMEWGKQRPWIYRHKTQ